MRPSIALRALGAGGFLFAVGFLWPASLSSTASAQEVTVGIDVEGPEVETESFRPVLTPYGEWVEAPGYGSVWRPYRRVVGPEFVPYGSSGHWVYTDAGWVWASSYDWGWATFHYGNWVYVDDSWAWRPGRVWAPAWVEWRYGGGYVGWAPMAPVGMVSVGFQPAPVQYVFVHTNNFTQPNMRAHVIVGAQAQGIVRQTEPMASVQVASGHTVSAVNAGPRPEAISQATGHAVAPVSVHTISAAAPPRSTPGVRFAEGASAEHPIAVRANAPANAAPPKGTGEALKPAPAVSKAPSASPRHNGAASGARPEPVNPPAPSPRAEPTRQAAPSSRSEPLKQAPPAALAAPTRGDTIRMEPPTAAHATPPPPATHANESPARPPPGSSNARPPPARPVEHQASSPPRQPPPPQRPPEARPPPPRPPPVAHPAQRHEAHESAPHAAAAGP